MKLSNSEVEKIHIKTCRIFDTLIKNSVADISEENRDSKYNELVQEIVLLVEEIVEGNNDKYCVVCGKKSPTTICVSCDKK